MLPPIAAVSNLAALANKLNVLEVVTPTLLVTLTTKDVTKEELVDFIDNLQQKDLEKIQQFFETAPKIKKDLKFSCHKCGYKENIVVEGLQNFFV